MGSAGRVVIFLESVHYPHDLAVGIASLLAFFVAYLVVLSWADYSFVQPFSAISYGVVAALSFFLLHEVVTPLQWAGVGIICFGVFVVGNTSPRTTKRD